MQKDINTTRVIHLEKPNTLGEFLSEKERQEIVSLKITGYIGREDFEDVLDDMCTLWGVYDDDDNYIPEEGGSAALRYLDLGEAVYTGGDELPYFGYHAQLETLILPQGVKDTTDGADNETGMSESETLKTLVLPEGLKKVGGFNSCENLTGLVLPEGLEEIKSFAFCGCESIISIRIPSSVIVFDGSCFADCNIKEYVVDGDNPNYTAVDGVVYTKDLTKLVAFPSAYPNKNFVVPDTTHIIGDCAFMDSRIDSIKLPDSLTIIEGWSFEGSKIRSIDIPDSVTEIGELAFRFCHELEHVKLPSRIRILHEQLFSCCLKLETITIPATVEKIESFALHSEQLKTIVIEGSNPPGISTSVRDGESIRPGVEVCVPQGEYQTYKTAHGWKNYKIKEV